MEHRSPRFKQAASTGMLLVTAFIWGMCFVAQRSGMEHLGPFLFNGLRYILGAMSLLVVLGGMMLFSRRAGAGGVVASGSVAAAGEPGLAQAEGWAEQQGMQQAAPQSKPSGRTASLLECIKAPASASAHGLGFILLSGLLCGVALYCASNLQQCGMVTVTASKAAFITTLYIVLVPVLGLLVRQRTHWNTWVSVGIAVVGLYLLCVGESFALEPGDTILLVSAFFWAVHILAVGHFAPHLELRKLLGLCVVQFFVAGVLSLITAPFADSYFVAAPVTLEAVSFVVPELAYAGVLSTAVAFTLAAVGQKYAQPAPAAVIMSLESVFGLLGGVVVLGEMLALSEWLGCVLMFVAVILTQLNFGAHKVSSKPV